MKINNSQLKLAKEWLVKGQNDLKSAAILYEENGPSDALCFHCHQAIEKYLKGFLVYHKKEFSKTHDLIFLANLCAKIDKDFSATRKYLVTLNKYYIQFRYPPEIKSYTKEECGKVLKNAEKMAQFVINKII